MATTKQTPLLLQHPSHQHPLKLLNLRIKHLHLSCHLCHREISSAEAYTCKEGCDTSSSQKDRQPLHLKHTPPHIHGYSMYSYHRICVEAPPQIVRHPLHLKHPLPLIHGHSFFKCDACGELYSNGSSFRCVECDFDLDICCALSTLSDEGGSQGGKTSEQITLPLHPHTLTSFSTRHDFVTGSHCYICQGSVKGDGYMCVRRSCKFIIHKRCIQDLYYADGTKAPRVYHGHPLEVFVRGDTGSNTCASCGSDESGEFIGCASCQVFYHRHCFQVPEILQYPSHNPDHTLVLFPKIDTQRTCQRCTMSLMNEIFYRCTSCEFLVHIRCAFQVIGYCEEGMSTKIELSWHKHPLLLCHILKHFLYWCTCCGEKFDGPTAYVCGEEDCGLKLHKQCTELALKIDHHPHHPEHQLALLSKVSEGLDQCAACCSTIEGFSFSCEFCEFYLHVKCVSRLPSRKHYLHEHDLIQFNQISSVECNRCRTAESSPIFRCVPCNFNLHEKCMELPPVMKHETHFHPLTLRDFFMEDDTGEYYCDLCEKRRDGRLGVYVCGHCELKMDRPWAFHIECVLPELRKVYVKEDNTIAMERLADQITRKEEEVRATEWKLDKMKRELEELRKKHASMALE